MTGRAVPRALLLLFIAPLSGCGARSGLFAGEAPDGAPVADTSDSSREDVVSSRETGLDACGSAITPCTTVPSHAIVLFGGTLFVGDTWEWDGSVWTQHSVPGPSTPRLSCAMATLGAKAVLFGGNNPNDLGDTWEWDGRGWTQRNVSGPSARGVHAMATLGNTVVLFGGTGSGPGFAVADTWTWDGSVWTQRNVPGPSARNGHAMATLGGTVVLFGGTRYAPSASDLLDLSYTWTWDGSGWTQHDVPGPGPRAQHAMATLNGKVVLFGGQATAGFMGDTWEWDGSAWTQRNVSGPPARVDHAMAALNGKVVLFGGSTPGTDTDTWEWDGSSWTVRNGPAPEPRYRHAMAAR